MRLLKLISNYIQTIHKIMASKRKLDNGKHPLLKKSNFGAWNMGLRSHLENPEAAEYNDDKMIIIKDKFPKAKHHFLVLPKENIPNLKSLTKDNIELLKSMEAKAQQVVDRCKLNVEFRYGYHAVPSMSHLHLHAISQDFNSPCLKTKKHWNSFTTKYFVDSEDVIKQIQENGKFLGISAEESKTLLNSPLSCHRCEKEFSVMPKLKEHILSHEASVD